MMRYIKNMVFVTLLSLLMFNMSSVNSYATETNVVKIKADTINHSSDSYIVMKADIITKYRMYYGKLQYRRWNKATGKWVDSHWIDA